MSRSRPDRTYAIIRERILSGEYRPAQHLVESELAENLGVGRHAVRLALERLDAEQLVTITRHRGTVVRALTVDEALDILLAREVLEGAAARLAARRMSDQELAELARHLQTMESALPAGALEEYSRANVEFHQGIARACGSRKIPELIESLRAQVVRLQFRTVLLPGRGEQSLAEHRQIYEGLASRDEKQAEEAMRTHIQALRRTLADSWELLGA